MPTTIRDRTAHLVGKRERWGNAYEIGNYVCSIITEDKPFYANGKDEIRNNAGLVQELKDLGSSF